MSEKRLSSLFCSASSAITRARSSALAFSINKSTYAADIAGLYVVSGLVGAERQPAKERMDPQITVNLKSFITNLYYLSDSSLFV